MNRRVRRLGHRGDTENKTLRMPKSLIDRIKGDSEKEGCSANVVVTRILANHYGDQEQLARLPEAESVVTA